mgnify:CR=1 FL=1|tara:strand:- start:122 stop:379 length:258 start_codon:yes stop_codon:yes gene_type:complete
MTQRQVVLDHFSKHKKITSWDAIMEYGITRLANVIFNLRNDGYVIHSENKTVHTRLGNVTTIAEYTLLKYPEKQSVIMFNSHYDV